MNDLLITMIQCAIVAIFLALYDYHFTRATKHMQFQWWSPFIPFISPLLRSLWQTIAVSVVLITAILILGKL